MVEFVSVVVSVHGAFVDGECKRVNPSVPRGGLVEISAGDHLEALTGWRCLFQDIAANLSFPQGISGIFFWRNGFDCTGRRC